MIRSSGSWFLLLLLSLVVPLAACQSVEMRKHGAGTTLPGHGHGRLPAAGDTHPGAAQVLELSAGMQLDQIIPKIADKRVVYVGETHDRYSHHLVQLEIVRRLHQLNPDIAIGMEFFQQPFQPDLDAYITEIGRASCRERV